MEQASTQSPLLPKEENTSTSPTNSNPQSPQTPHSNSNEQPQQQFQREHSVTKLASPAGEKNLGKPVLNANDREYDGYLIFGGAKHHVKFTKKGVSWKKMTSEKSNPTSVNWSDIVGVESHPFKETAFVLYTFQKVTKTERERKAFSFLSNDQAMRDTWICVCRCFLAGTDISETQMPPKKNITVFVNPFGGKGKALEIWKTVKVMFEIGFVNINMIETQRALHALDATKELNLSKCDGIITVSGDGLLYEVINGLLKREDWRTAIQTPVGVIPGGSGNGLAASLNALNPLHAAFYVLKGHSIPFDLFTATQKGEKHYGFLSLSWGIIADIDRDSEKYRKLMGGFRFTFTALQKVFNIKEYSGKVTFIPLELSKQGCGLNNCDVCKKQLQDLKLINENGSPTISPKTENANSETQQQPNTPTQQTPLEYLKQHPEKAMTIDGAFQWFQANNTSHTSYDAKVAPYAHFSDGMIDLTMVHNKKKLGTINMAKALIQMEEGKHVNVEGMEYYKTKALILEPNPNQGKIMIDGEMLEVAPIELEVLQGMAKIFIDPSITQK